MKKIKFKALLALIVILIITMGCNESKKGSFENGLIDINGTSLYVELAGQGEPIIVIHGGPVMDHSYLQPHFKALEKNYQLVYYDQRVSGRSSTQVDTTDINIKAFIDDIEGIRRHFNFDSVHILAHSWGGLPGMEYALKYPNRTKSLLLISSMPPNHQLWQEEQTVQAKQISSEDSIKRKQIIQSDLFNKNPPKAIEQLLRLSFKSQFKDSTLADSLNLYVPVDYLKRSRLFGNLAPYLANYDLTDELQELAVPTLVIYGSLEPSAQISGPILKTNIRNSELQVIERSGHFSFMEQKQKFNEIVLEFLNSHLN